jgi:Flp pilus assembly protein TadG
MAKRERRRGSAILEFTFTGIPLIFVWISVVQMSLGMWHYHTLQYATKAAGEYAAFHGLGCAGACNKQIKDVAAVLANYAIGIPASSIQCTFKTLASDHTTACGSTISCQLDSCETNVTAWPPTGCNTANANDLTILTGFQFNPAMGMVAPGAGVVRFGSAWFPAFTHQMIVF